MGTFKKDKKMILHIPNILSKEQLIECRKLLDNANWIDGKLTAGSQAVNVKSNLQLAENDELLEYLRKVITNALNKNPLFISATLPNHIISPFVNRYEICLGYPSDEVIDSLIFSLKNNMGIDSSILVRKDGQRNISISKKDSKISFYEKIVKFIHPSMKYKIEILPVLDYLR